MKTTLPFLHTAIRTLTAAAFVLTTITAKSQTTEMKFQNPALTSGSALADGAVYRFSDVGNNLDALMTIGGRSSALVSIANLDIPGQGFPNAFQPQIRYNNGNVSSATTWWIEFRFQFVTKNTGTAVSVPEFFVTGLDIDGNGSRLREWDAFYGASSYKTENNSLLGISNLVGTLIAPLVDGKQFMGSQQDYSGIDTSATELMTTATYKNTSTVTIRLGATTTGSANNANRMYSVWFKNFNYIAPISTLPVKLSAFTASLNQEKVHLKWQTSAEINVSHFEVERSTDGTNFTQAGLVFAYGSANTQTDYAFTDNTAGLRQSVVYYRLRCVDIDGKTDFSETRIIRLGAAAEMISLQTYPNPVMNEVRVTVPATWQNKQTVFEIYTANGTLAARKTTSGNNQTESFNTVNLAPGFYIVRATADGQTATQKIVKH